MIRPYDERPKFESIPQALDLLRQAAQTRGGDYKYTPPEGVVGCLYVHDGSCSCLIGVALALLGWSVEEIEQLDARRPTSSVICLGGLLTEDNPVGADVNRVLAAAQAVQDMGLPWNDALNRALLEASERMDPASFLGYVRTLYLLEAKS